MKNDLIITRFKTETMVGTMNPKDVKTFFGSKMVNIEDTINIDNSEIQYSEVFDIDFEENNGYQYFDDFNNVENIYLINLYDVKRTNQNISLVQQSSIDIRNNTQWRIDINWKNILSDYIFYKLKNRRTFKSIKYTDVLNENINLFIRDYIKDNLINRYEFSEIRFYVKYYDLEEGDEFRDPNLLFTPNFVNDIKEDKYFVKNINTNIIDNILRVNYKQVQPSTDKKFNYYFDLIFRKI
ncbi:MAG: hypothetical protein ACOC3V_05000 [bacterium]